MPKPKHIKHSKTHKRKAKFSGTRRSSLKVEMGLSGPNAQSS